MKFRKFIGGKYQETVEFRFRDVEVIADAAYIKTKSGVLQCIDCDDEEHKVEVVIKVTDEGNSPRTTQWSKEFDASKETLPIATTKGSEMINLLDYQKHIFDERESNIQGKKVTICGEPSTY